MKNFALTVFVAAFAVPLGADAQPVAAAESAVIEYTVKKGDTCFQIAQSHYGDSRFVDLLHAANPGMGPAPHALKEGSVLKLPPKPKPEADAKLDHVRNKVEVSAPAPKPGKPNDPLFRGNRVSTMEESSADVRFARDNSQIRLGEHTLVVILGDSNGAAAKVPGETTLVTGSLRARLGELEGKKREPAIVTPSGRVAMTGKSEIQVSVDKANTARLAVYKGSSSLAAGRKQVRVPENFGSKAELGKEPTPPAPLPGAPSWAALPPGLVFAEVSGTSFAGEFAPATKPPSVAVWHVELATDPDFRDLVLDVRLGTATQRLEARGVPNGTYYARVSGIDADLFEGPFGEVSQTLVVPFTLTRQGDIVIVPAAAQVECSIDGAPAAPRLAVLTLDARSKHELRCSAIGGKGPAATVVSEALPAPAPVVLPPPVLRPILPRKDPVAITVEALASVRATSSSLAELGAGIAGGFGVRAPLGRGGLGLGVRIGRELYLERTSYPAQFAGAAAPFTHGAVSVELPVSYHFGRARTGFIPYFALSPALLIQDGTFQLPTGGERRSDALLFALGAQIGAEYRMGPGRMFAELGYRTTDTRSFDFAGIGMRGVTLSLGYRFVME
jgi:LysM domain